MMNRYEKILDGAFVNGSAPATGPAFNAWLKAKPGLWEHFYRSWNGFIEKRSLLLGLLTDGSMGYQRQWFFDGNTQMEFQSSWQQVWATLNPLGKHLWISGAGGVLAGSIAIFIASIS